MIVSRPVCLGVRHPSGSHYQIFVIANSCGYAELGRPLWHEDGSIVYNSLWPSQAHSFSNLSPAALIAVFYCQIFKSLQIWNARSRYLYLPKNKGTFCAPRHGFSYTSFAHSNQHHLHYSLFPLQLIYTIRNIHKWLYFFIFTVRWLGPSCSWADLERNYSSSCVFLVRTPQTTQFRRIQITTVTVKQTIVNQMYIHHGNATFMITN
jgi:hypothetical protein